MSKAYQVIVADPPWAFKTYSPKGMDRSAENHYSCMSLNDIKALPVASYAAQNCALFLWATDPLLPQALETMAAWGFRYATVGFYWAKTNTRSAGWFTGLGYWTRANPELCLLGTRGAPKRLSAAVPKLLVAPRREHSRKPDEAFTRIEQLLPGPYLELFSRQSRPGWDCLGNQAGLFDAANPAVI